MPFGCAKWFLERKRGHWNNSTIAFLALVCYSTGFGNVVFFPSYVKKHSVAFLLPYFVLMLVIGVPMVAFEVALGQYLCKTAAMAYRSLAPIWTGIGGGMVFVCVLYAVHYNYHLAITLMVVIKSLRPLISSWRTEDDDIYLNYLREMSSSLSALKQDIHKSNTNHPYHSSASAHYFSTQTSTPPSFNAQILGEDELATYFLLSWGILALLLLRGLQHSTSVILVVAVMPFLILVITICIQIVQNGVSLEVLSSFEFESLFGIVIWADAAQQVLFTLGIATGALCTLASFNRIHYDIFRSSVLTFVVNFLTSLLGCYLIIGALQTPDSEDRLQASIKEDTTSVVVLYLQKTEFFVTCLFLAFFLMGLGVQLAFVETAITFFMDYFSSVIPRYFHFVVVIVTCTLQALVGLWLCSPNGHSFYLQFAIISDTLQFLLTMFLAIVIFFSGDVLLHHVVEERNFPLSPCVRLYFRLSWKLFTPVCFLVCFIFHWYCLNWNKANFMLMSFQILPLAFITVSTVITCAKLKHTTWLLPDPSTFHSPSLFPTATTPPPTSTSLFAFLLRLLIDLPSSSPSHFKRSHSLQPLGRQVTTRRGTSLFRSLRQEKEQEEAESNV